MRLSAVLLLLFVLSSTANVAVAQQSGFPHGEFPLTDFDRRNVALSEILSGGPPRDGIPAIDKPTFVDAAAADDWLNADEPVIALTLGNVTRAYPLQILMFHEIVNDDLGGTPVAVTFCPLCNASIVFDRTVGDRVLDFGTTGRLRRSDLVMYDRQSESWWQQFTGRGIIGRYTDTTLDRLPSSIVGWQTVRDAFPDVMVLSLETGFRRPYGSNPYRGYDRIDSQPFLFDSPTDPRLPPMERVLVLPGERGSRLVTLSRLAIEPVINLDIDRRPVAVLAATHVLSALDQAAIADSRAIPAAAGFDARVDGRTLTFTAVTETDDATPVVRDEQTNSRWDAFGHAIDGELAGAALESIDLGVHFAFAWFAFDPDAQVLGKP